MLSTSYCKTVRAIILCFLIITPDMIKTSSTDTVGPITSTQSYIIACFASCCLGAALYALLHRLCGNPITLIIPKGNPEVTPEQIKQHFYALDSIKKNQETIINLLKTQAIDIKTIHTDLIAGQKQVSKEIEALQSHQKTSSLQNPLLLEKLNGFNQTYPHIALLCSALYWAQQSKIKTQELEKYKIQANMTLTALR